MILVDAKIHSKEVSRIKFTSSKYFAGVEPFEALFQSTVLLESFWLEILC